MKKAATVFSLACCAACRAQEHTQASVHDQRQAELYQIADKCGLPRSAVPLEGDNELHFKPPVDAKYESVDCVLSALRKANLPVKMGFVGVESYDRNIQ